jgi:hypothetical protein
MGQGQADFSWQVVEKEDEWEALHRSHTPEDSATAGPSGVLGRRLLGLAMAVLLLVAGAGAYLHHQGRQGLARVQVELQHTVDREEGVQIHHPVAPNAVLPGDARPGHPQEVGVAAPADSTHPTAATAEIQDMELHGDLALVVVVSAEPDKPWLPLPYRQTRTFREGPAGWVPTASRPDLWGPPRTLETEHFRFAFRRRDTAAVVEIAGEVGALYTGLRRDVGLGPPEDGDVLTVEIVPEFVPIPNAVYRFPASQRLVLPSPELLPVPAEQTAAEVLRQMVVGELAGRVLGEMWGRAPVPDRWRLLIDGVLLWHSGDAVAPFDRYAYEREQALQARLVAGPPLRLDELLYPPGSPMSEIIPAHLPMAARTLIEYVVDGYGRERLPALVEGLRHYDTWEALVPAVFGVSVNEFEAGWHAYLAGRDHFW